MADKKYFWIKLPEDFFNDDQIKLLLREENGEKYVVFLIRLMLKTIKHEGGSVPIFHYEDSEAEAEAAYRELSITTDTDIDIVRSAIYFFNKYELIDTTFSGQIVIPKVLGMYGSEGASAKRTREYRERKLRLAPPVAPPVAPLCTNSAPNLHQSSMRETSHCDDLASHCDTELDLELDNIVHQECNESEYSKEFEEWWNIYPRKRDKKPAYKKYTAARKTHTHEQLLKSVKNYAKEQNGKEQQYIKLAKTFLNDSYTEYLTGNPDTPARKKLWCPNCLQFEESTSPTCLDCGAELLETEDAE